MTTTDAPTIPVYAKNTGVRRAYSRMEVLATIHALKDAGKSLRQIAREHYNGCISHAVIQRLLEGMEPHDPKIREALGLPARAATVYVIGGGEIPEGAQVVSASMCECGQPFISNHPARRKCFICSPYRKHVK